MSSVSKKALKDPVGWAAALVADHPDEAGGCEALRHADTLTPLADKLHQLQDERRRTSREIGDAKSRAANTSTLLARMRTLGIEAEMLKKRLCEELQTIAERLSAASADEADTPTPEESVPAYLVPPSSGTSLSRKVVILAVDTEAVAVNYTRYVRTHPARTSYHELALRELITDALGQRCHHLLAQDAAGCACGVLPLVQLESRLFGNYMVSMPWFNYGGPLADDDGIAEALLEAAAELAREAGCSHLEVRETHPRSDWTTRTHKVSMTLGLPDSAETLERGFGASVRAQSNKATRAGCTFRAGGMELLDDFYRVFATNMRDLGTPVHNRAFYESLLSLYGEKAFLAVVSHGRTPLAVGFLLAHDDTLEIPWASSLRRANPLGVNMLLYRRVLGEAVTRGYRVFDFGRSSPQSPTWRFKKQWGAVERQLYWHYWTAEGAEPPDDLSPDSSKYLLAIALWKRLPVPLTRVLGPPLVRGLP